MIAEERHLREQLAALAAHEDGRRLLQLGLRGIARGEQQLTAGCWTKHGNAGCLFQHAYWEGVREGVFPDRGRPGDWIGSLAGPHNYGIVIDAIAAFDQLARVAYADLQPRALLPDRVRIRNHEWNQAVEAMLVDVLGETPTNTVAEGDRIPTKASVGPTQD